MIELSVARLEELSRMVEGVPEQMERVLQRSLNRGLDAAKTRAFRSVSDKYDITQTEAKKNTRFWMKRARKEGDQVIGYIQYHGNKVPLYKFKGNQRTTKKGLVKVRVRRESARAALESAFITAMPNGHVGIFERVNGEYSDKRVGKVKRSKSSGRTKYAEAIKEKYGPSVPEMLENEQVIGKIQDEVQEMIDRRIDHELEQLLRGR